MNDDILDATGPELGAARGKASCRSFYRKATKRPIYRCADCHAAYHPDDSPYNVTGKASCPRCRSRRWTWIIAEPGR